MMAAASKRFRIVIKKPGSNDPHAYLTTIHRDGGITSTHRAEKAAVFTEGRVSGAFTQAKLALKLTGYFVEVVPV